MKTTHMKHTNSLGLALAITFAVFSMPSISTAQEDVRCNCVLFARQRVPALPSGLYNADDKRRIINSMFPRPGTVAVFSYNHVAAVTNVQSDTDGSLIVSIDEANYRPCQFGSRRGKMSELQIIGFFDPRFSPGNAPPQTRSVSTITGAAGRQLIATIAGSGFDPQSVQLVLMGGNYCTTWGRCTVPTSVIANRTSGSLSGPLTINSPGRYSLYVFNSRDGRSSNAVPVTITNPTTSAQTPARPRF